MHMYQRRQWHPTPVLLPGKSHGRRSLVGCSPVVVRVSLMFEAPLSDFPGGPVDKNPIARAGDTASIPGPGRPQRLQSC